MVLGGVHSADSFIAGVTHGATAQVLRTVYELPAELVWGANLEKCFKQGYSMAEAYVARHYGPHCRKLQWLIKHCDNADALRATDFGVHVLVRASTKRPKP